MEIKKRAKFKTLPVFLLQNILNVDWLAFVAISDGRIDEASEDRVGSEHGR